MDVDRHFEEVKIGDRLEPVTAEVTPELIKEYGDLLGDECGYYDENSDFSGPVGQPSLAGILIFRLYNVRAPAQPGAIHAKQEFEFYHPIRPGIITTISGTIVDKYEKRGRKYIVTETLIEDEEGLLLARGLGYGIVPY